MDDFKGLVEDFMGELLDNSIRNLKTSNTEYRKLDNKNNSIMAKIEEMTPKLSSKEQKLVSNFCDGLLEMEGMKQEYFYRCGFRDCLKFMKLMDK